MAQATRNYSRLVEVTSDTQMHHHSPVSSSQVRPQSSTEEEGQWSTSLMDCCEDAASCCYGFWCCPCLSCTVSGRLQHPYCLPLCDCVSCLSSLFCLVPLVVPPAGLALRVAMRAKYKIKGTLFNDMVVACCCSWCSWCQMHRELKHRMKPRQIINVQNVVSVQPLPTTNMTPATVTMDNSDNALPKY
ncbi:hypothetical protein NL108_012776 [Boleophthalmus pectinirostris]|uniref:cornifelin homolog n=1 Tax=Boleophthalmus pectinirostris TaxID=150288 RepID=UPI000A1C27E9|nr:cornifelin homolog [Boleophthalmus pectinirostris]KAJ0065522.1 hypothetical protein NL108_012776 [Boleophthalmus pectinirostris]